MNAGVVGSVYGFIGRPRPDGTGEREQLRHSKFFPRFSIFFFRRRACQSQWQPEWKPVSSARGSLQVIPARSRQTPAFHRARSPRGTWFPWGSVST